MSDDKLYIVGLIPMIIISIMHFIFFFVFKITNFNNIFDSLETSPLFNFHLDNQNCGADEYINFHTWEGIKETHYYYTGEGKNRKRHSKTIIKGKSEINKINGRYFCYRRGMTYKQLLYNDQIIKKNETCKDGYKNCGIIDTLEQKLCMPQDDECPLYDVGISEGDNYYKDNADYAYDENSRIYYNKNSYNEPNKKIIGKIVLNEGEPCYNLNEKLWRTFISKEAGENHLKCELEIFGKKSDDRYIKIGDISYYMIYRDNIDYEYYSLFPEKDTRSKYLSLYKREFFGIDKECDEKSEEFKVGYDILKKSQKSEQLLLLIEPILFFCGFFTIVFCKGNTTDNILACLFMQDALLFGACTICHIIFLSQIIHSDFPLYECSDKITNEISRKEYLNTNKTIIFTAINLAADILVILIIIFIGLYPTFEYCCDRFCDLIQCKNCKIYKEKTNNNYMRDVNINNNKNKMDEKRKKNAYSSKENNDVVIYKNKNQYNSTKYSDNNTEHNVTQDLNKAIDSKSKI
jgi:hypothetical protein